jgi:hypothetical protein
MKSECPSRIEIGNATPTGVEMRKTCNAMLTGLPAIRSRS